MGLEPESFPIRTLRRRAKTNISAPTESFKDKTVLITGASGSICSGVARILIGLEVNKLIFGVRNVEKGTRVAHELAKDFDDGEGPEILVWSLELQSYASVQEFAHKVATLQRLDNVLMGAGTCNSGRKISGEGWEESELCLSTSGLHHIYHLGC
jgi:NAD(P)-dependent dehydrogenase (short-subunit alcohol dehydrogenase family)